MRGNHRTFWMLLGLAPLFLSSGIGAVATPAFLRSINFGTELIGIASSIGLLLSVLFPPLFGRLGMRFSNRNAVALCLLLDGAASLIMLLFRNMTAFIVSRALSRLIPTCAAVCSYTYLVQMSRSDADRSRAMVAMTTLSASLPAFGYLIGGFLTEKSVTLAFAVQMAIMLVAAPVIMRAEKDTPTLEKLGSVRAILAQENPVVAFRRCLRSAPSGTPLLFALVSAVSIGYALFDQSFIYYLQIRLQVPASMSGVVRALIGGVAILVNFTLTMVMVRRFNSAKAIIPIALLCAAASGCAALTGTEAAFIISGGLFYASINVLLAFQNKIFGDFAAKGNSELLSSCNYTVDCFASAAGSLAAGFIYNIDPLMPYSGATILYLCVPAVAMLIYRKAYADRN